MCASSSSLVSATELRTIAVPTIAVAGCLALSVLDVAPARAQLDRGARERVAYTFGAYDLDGPETLDAIARLSEEIRAGRPVVGAPRLAHTRAAADLWLLSKLDPERAHLEQDVAAALGVPSFAVVATLREGLGSAGSEELAAEAEDVQRALELQEAIASGTPVSLSNIEGLRRDALLVRVVGRAIDDGDDAELEAWYDDPCGDEPRCDARWARWAPSSRTIVAALEDAAGAVERLDEAWWAKDPFARAVLPALSDDARRIELHVHTPALVVPEVLGLAVAPWDEGIPARVDLLVVARADGVRIVEVQPIGIRSGRLVEVDRREAEQATESTIEVPVPRVPGEDPPVLDRVVERLRAIDLAPDAVVAVGVDDEVSASRFERVLASMVAAQRAPTGVALRASDGTLRIAPVQVVDADSVGAPADVVLDAASPEPRVLEGAGGGRRVVVRAGPAVPARAVVDAAFDAARSGDLVALVGQ